MTKPNKRAKTKSVKSQYEKGFHDGMVTLLGDLADCLTIPEVIDKMQVWVDRLEKTQPIPTAKVTKRRKT